MFLKELVLTLFMLLLCFSLLFGFWLNGYFFTGVISAILSVAILYFFRNGIIKEAHSNNISSPSRSDGRVLLDSNFVRARLQRIGELVGQHHIDMQKATSKEEQYSIADQVLALMDETEEYDDYLQDGNIRQEHEKVRDDVRSLYTMIKEKVQTEGFVDLKASHLEVVK